MGAVCSVPDLVEELNAAEDRENEERMDTKVEGGRRIRTQCKQE